MLTLAYCMLVTQAFATGFNYVATDAYDFDTKGDHAQMIKAVFDKYRYRMTVEWDQTDAAFKEHAKSELEKDILQLQSYGVRLDDIKAYMTDSLLNGQAKKDYEALVVTLKKQGKDDSEVAKAASKFMEENYNRGASYSGGASGSWAGVAVLIAVVVVVVVTVIVIRNRHNDDRDPEEEPCDQDLVKGFGGGWGGGDDCCYGGFGNKTWDPCGGYGW